jgi:hypothetical protein
MDREKKIKTRNERQERLERENLSLRSAWQTITDTKRQKTSATAKNKSNPASLPLFLGRMQGFVCVCASTTFKEQSPIT